MERDRSVPRSNAGAKSFAVPELGDAYEMRGLLGSGAMGAVYRVHDRRLERDVAVKVLPVSLLDDAGVRTRFLREARALALCKHPNIIQVHGCSEEGAPIPYLITELVDGPSLQEWLRERGPFPWPVALSLTVELLKGLAMVHRRGIIHRDLKPSNVLIDEDGVPKLADFGIARMTDVTTLTGAEALVGTVRYLPPEAFDGAAAAPAQDIYSMGCVLYEIIAGQPAFGHGNAAELMRVICHGSAAPLDTLRPGTPAAVAALVQHAISRSAADRPGSAEEMGEACRRLLEAEGVGDTARLVTVHVTEVGPSALETCGDRPTLPSRPILVPPRPRGLLPRLSAFLRAAFSVGTLPTSFRPVSASSGTRVDADTQRILWATHFGDALRLVLGLALLATTALVVAPWTAGHATDAIGLPMLVVAGLAHTAVFLATGVAGPTPRARRIALGGLASGAVLGLMFIPDCVMIAELLPDRWLLDVSASIVVTLGLSVLVTLAEELRGVLRAPARGTVWGTATALVVLVLGTDLGRSIYLERAHLKSTVPLTIPASAAPPPVILHAGAVLASSVALWSATPGMAPLRVATEGTPDAVAGSAELGSLPLALHVAATDAMLLASGPARARTGDLTAIYGTERDRADLARIGRPAAGTALLEAPAATAEGTAAAFFEAHTALSLALARRTGARYIALPAITAALFLRAAKRSTEAELVLLLEKEAGALKRELPGVAIGFLEPVLSPDISLAEAIADRPWVDWIAAVPFPGTVPVKELDQVRERLSARGAGAKLALLTAAPLVPSRYWPWHEAEHAALVTLAARYARSRALRLWIHAPVRSFEPYAFRRQRGILAPTGPLEALRASLR